MPLNYKSITFRIFITMVILQALLPMNFQTLTCSREVSLVNHFLLWARDRGKKMKEDEGLFSETLFAYVR